MSEARPEFWQLSRLAETALGLERSYGRDVWDWPISRVLAASRIEADETREATRRQALAVNVGFSGDQKSFEEL